MEKGKSNREGTDQKLQEMWNTEDAADRKLQEKCNTENTINPVLQEKRSREDIMDQEQQEGCSREDTVDQVLMSRLELITSQNQQADKADIFKKQDYIQAAVIMILCLCAVVAGAFLAT